MTGILSKHCPHYILTQGLERNLEFIDLSRLAGH